MLAVWLEFSVCAVLILFAGTMLSRTSDVIAEKTGMGRTWAGLILLATVTSLPELFSGVSSITVIDAPDIALGALMGSCVFNLALIAVIDLLHRPSSIYTIAGQGHILSAILGVGLISLVGFGIMGAAFGALPSLAHMGVVTLAILGLYLFACKILFDFERRRVSELSEPAVEIYAAKSLPRAIVLFVVAGLVVVLAAMRLPILGDRIAEELNWNQSFVGTLFIAFATSVPELVVTITAVRMGALDLGISNVLGSNLFNMAIIGVLDIVYRKGPILSDVSVLHAATGFSALMMSALVVIGLLYRPKGRVLNTIGWISIFLILIFIANSFLLYQSSNG